MKKQLLLIILMTVLCAPAIRAEDALPAGNQEESAGSPFSQTKFVPDISLILDALYVYRSNSDEDFSALHSPEFTLAPADEQRHGHEEPYFHRGFNFNYAEITFSSIVDPYFELFAVCEFAEKNIGLEEAYFTTRSLPLGFQLKAGKFLSSFGRLNEQHTHYWDFVDIPLIYNAFFAKQPSTRLVPDLPGWRQSISTSCWEPKCFRDTTREVLEMKRCCTSMAPQFPTGATAQTCMSGI